MTAPVPAAQASAAPPGRLPTLTGMRAIAAGMVFLTHVVAFSFFAAPAVPDAVNKVVSANNGYLGVSFFFILSGFVLTWVARDTDTVGAFWRRRALKIYPNHVLTFLAAVVLFVVVLGQPQRPFAAVTNLFLLQAWSPHMEISHNLNVVTWTLSCEALFYVLFPFILALIRRIRGELLWRCFGAVVLVIWVIPYLATRLGPGPASFPGLPPDDQVWVVYILPAARLPEFVLGMLLARIVAGGRRIPVGVGGGIALTFVAGLAAHLLPTVYQLVAVWVVPLALTVAAGAVADVEGRRTFLSWRGMVWLGEISFAIYLWHFLVLAAARSRGPLEGFATPVAIGLILALLAVTVLVSWATFARFERPIMRRFANGRRRPTPVTTAGLPAPTPVPAMEVAPQTLE